MANAPPEPDRVERAPEPVDDVPSLDQLRWMLQTEGMAVPAEAEASVGSPVCAAGRPLGRAMSPIRLCGSLALLAAVVAIPAMLHATDPAASAARAVSAPGLQARPMPTAARPTPKVTVDASRSAVPLAPAPADVVAPPAAASPGRKGAMTLAPWADRSAMSILAPNPAAPPASPGAKATPGTTAEIARPPEVMPDVASRPPPARRRAAESEKKPRHRAARVAFRRFRSHAHHHWRTASWRYPPYPSGTGYYFVRGSARAY